MQCQNCEQEITVEDGEFCPFCGALPHLPVKKKKKKNEEIERLGAASQIGEESAISYKITALLCGLAFLAIALSPNSSNLKIIPASIVGLASLLFFLFYLMSNRCIRCRYRNTTTRISHEKIKSQQVNQIFYGNKRHIVEVNTFEDNFRCSHCGYERTHTYVETGKSSIK